MAYDEDTLQVYHGLTEEGKAFYEQLLAERLQEQVKKAKQSNVFHKILDIITLKA